MKSGLGNGGEIVCSSFFIRDTNRRMFYPNSHMSVATVEGDDLTIREKNFTYRLSDFETIKSLEVVPKLESTPSTRTFYITRVCKSTDLTMTALYGFDATYPFLILPTCLCAVDFNIGDIISAYPDRYSGNSDTARLSLSHYDEVRSHLESIYQIKVKDEGIYQSQLNTTKKKYKDLFMSGKLDEFLYDNIAVQQDGTIAFNNVVMEIRNRDILENFLSHLIEGRFSLNDSFVSSVLRRIGKAIVNGVSIEYEIKISKESTAGISSERSYINGYRINKDEHIPALDAVLCYTGNQKGYDEYLSGVSKISLYRQGFIRNGIPLMIESYSGIFEGSSEKIVEALSEYELDLSASLDTIAYTCQVPFRKIKNNKPAIFIFDKWRKVENFDFLVRACENAYINRHRDIGRLELNDEFFVGFGSFYSEFRSISSINYRYSDNVLVKGFISIMSKLYFINACLATADRIIPADFFAAAHYGYRSFVTPNKKMAETLHKLYTDAIGMFKISTDDRLKSIVRSKQLLEETIKQQNIRVLKNAEGKINQFVVQGNSGTLYKVSTAGRVHHEVDGREEYICIGYDGSKTIVGFDYTVSVLTALANDKHTADKIHTIQRFVNKPS